MPPIQLCYGFIASAKPRETGTETVFVSSLRRAWDFSLARLPFLLESRGTLLLQRQSGLGNLSGVAGKRLEQAASSAQQRRS
eukprot:scaffold846_cov252-Pinguiococcus_pyrenoidosus.AAC.13